MPRAFELKAVDSESVAGNLNWAGFVSYQEPEQLENCPKDYFSQPMLAEASMLGSAQESVQMREPENPLTRDFPKLRLSPLRDMESFTRYRSFSGQAKEQFSSATRNRCSSRHDLHTARKLSKSASNLRCQFFGNSFREVIEPNLPELQTVSY